MVHENIKELMAGFRYDAHPMGDARVDGGRALDLLPRGQGHPRRPRSGSKQIFRLIAKMPTLAAFAYRHSIGLPYAYPDNDLSLLRRTSSR